MYHIERVLATEFGRRLGMIGGDEAACLEVESISLGSYLFQEIEPGSWDVVCDGQTIASDALFSDALQAAGRHHVENTLIEAYAEAILC